MATITIIDNTNPDDASSDDTNPAAGIRQIHALHISWLAMLKLAIFCAAVILFIIGLGDTPAQSATYFVNTYEPAIATSDDARNLYIANLVIAISSANGNVAYITGAAMFIIAIIMLYWMTISFNLARAADPIVRKVPIFAGNSSTSYRAPHRDPFNFPIARHAAEAVPHLKYIVRLASRYHNSFHPGDNRKIVKIMLFSFAIGILFAGTGDMLFNAAEYDIRNQGSHHWTIYIANLRDANANLALLAGSLTFLATVAIRVAYFIFVKFIFYGTLATFGVLLGVGNTLQTDHDKWNQYQLELNQPAHQDIPNLPGNAEPLA